MGKLAWLGGTVRRWVSLVGLISTAAGVVTFAANGHVRWAWLAIGGLALLVVSSAWTAHDEHRRRVALESTPHQPPGDGVPLHAPTEYQVKALRQVVPRVAETINPFGYWELEETLKNMPRHGVDPVYEPLRSVDEGLERMVELGELEKTERGWRLPSG
jgi:hypothetical protein